MQWHWIKHLNASSQCSDHLTLSLVVRNKHLNDTSQHCRILNPSTGSAREEDIAIAMSWFSLIIISYFVSFSVGLFPGKKLCFRYFIGMTDPTNHCISNYFIKKKHILFSNENRKWTLQPIEENISTVKHFALKGNISFEIQETNIMSVKRLQAKRWMFRLVWSSRVSKYTGSIIS